MYAEGPVVFGTQLAFPQEQATLMVARTENKDPDCEPADRSLWVKGNVRVEGDDGTKHALMVTGNDTYFLGNHDQTGNMAISGNLDIAHAVFCRPPPNKRSMSSLYLSGSS